MRMIAIKTVAIVGLLMSASALSAADEFGLDKGENEASGLVGISDGNLTLGGSYGKAVTDKILVLGELSYISGGSASGTAAGTTFKASAHALGVGLGLHYNFNGVFKSNPNLVPYAGAGIGVLRYSASSSGGGFSASASDSSLFFQFGGGLRYYVRPNWGLRPEVMIFAGKDTFVRAAVGIFYQF
jgi:opacity protein-like surface antigen